MCCRMRRRASRRVRFGASSILSKRMRFWRLSTNWNLSTDAFSQIALVLVKHSLPWRSSNIMRTVIARSLFFAPKSCRITGRLTRITTSIIPLRRIACAMMCFITPISRANAVNQMGLIWTELIGEIMILWSSMSHITSETAARYMAKIAVKTVICVL